MNFFTDDEMTNAGYNSFIMTFLEGSLSLHCGVQSSHHSIVSCLFADW